MTKKVSNILNIRTNKAQALKTLIENLQLSYNQVNFVFKPTKGDNEGYLSIKEVNKQNSMLSIIKLYASKFEKYECNIDKDEIVLGIDIVNLSKCLKTISNDTILHLNMSSMDTNHLNILLENGTDNKHIMISLLDLKYKHFSFDDMTFPYEIKLPSNQFHKYCKDLSIASEKIEILCNGKKLQLSSFEGEHNNFKYEILPKTPGFDIISTDEVEDENIVQGIFDIKYLSNIAKCNSLDDTVTLYLDNKSPMVIKYNVSSLGTVKFVLSAIVDDTN